MANERIQIERLIDVLEDELNDCGPWGSGYSQALYDVRHQMRLRFGPAEAIAMRQEERTDGD